MSTTIKPDYGPRGKYQTAKGRLILSTWPFADGYPWDEELLHSHHRALTTHGPSTNELREAFAADFPNTWSTTTNGK